jgi:hypothetical protein
MQFTSQQTFTNLGPQNVVAQVPCNSIQVREASTSGATTRYDVYLPSSGVSGVAAFERAIGETQTFGGQPICPSGGVVFQAGQVVGQINLVDSASALFNLECQ